MRLNENCLRTAKWIIRGLLNSANSVMWWKSVIKTLWQNQCYGKVVRHWCRFSKVDSISSAIHKCWNVLLFGTVCIGTHMWPHMNLYLNKEAISKSASLQNSWRQAFFMCLYYEIFIELYIDQNIAHISIIVELKLKQAYNPFQIPNEFQNPASCISTDI